MGDIVKNNVFGALDQGGASDPEWVGPMERGPCTGVLTNSMRHKLIEIFGR